MFSIQITDGNQNQRHELISEGSVMIGRGRECRIRLDGWKIGKEHARIYRSSGGLFIQDLGQFYGTQVNGSRVNQHGPLTEQDEIYLGSYKLTVQDKAEVTPNNQIPVSVKPSNTIRAQEVGLIKEKPQPNDHHGWRTRIHGQLLDTIDLRRRDILGMEDQELRAETEVLVRELINKERARPVNKTYLEGTGNDRRAKLRSISTPDYEKIIQDVMSEAVGLGPLEELLADDSITEIMVNRYDEIFLERAGRLELHHTAFTSDRAVLGVIERIVAPIGRRIDESSPMVDARLKDGSRVNAIIPPLALKGPALTIRKFSRRALTTQDLIDYGSISVAMSEFMRVCVLHRKSMIISGGTGSGKTTLLNVLSNFIPENERIITIEDAAELRLNQPNLVSLEARPSNAEGRGQIAIRDLVKNALRMRPDRIVVGECRGGEALDMLQAMNTGHEGSLTTLHANNARDALARLETLILMAGMDLPLAAIREQIASAVDIIIQQARLTDGRRVVTSIVEVTGMESGKIQLQEIFRFEPKGRNEQGRIQGKFTACDAIPTFYEHLREAGLPIDISLFDSKGEK
jgi:pilus assembly protein CpaF